MDVAILVSVAVVAGLVVLFALFLWASYSSLVALRARVDEAWRDITVQLRRRADLIPDIVRTVEEYAQHEQSVLRSADTARAESVEASTPAAATVAESHVQQALRGVLAVAEGYPQLSASPRFLQLRGELGDTEERIHESRRFFNGGVREFNTKIGVFPNTVFARRRGFSRREFFEAPDGPSVAQPPRIQF